MFHFATLPHQAGGRGRWFSPTLGQRPISPQPIHALEAHLMEPMATATSHMLRCSRSSRRVAQVPHLLRVDQDQVPLIAKGINIFYRALLIGFTDYPPKSALKGWSRWTGSARPRCCHVASWRPQTFATSVPVKPQRSLLAMSS